MPLTETQRRAVESWQQGDICVTAGPGSGKTRVLVERLRWLVLEREVPAERILAITFTEKAAHEMRARLLGTESVPRERRTRFENAQISTIDAFCSRLLKENALDAGVDPAFEMLDEAERLSLLHAAIEGTLDEAFAEGGEPLREFLAAYAPGTSRSGAGGAFALRDHLADLAHRIRSFGCEPFQGPAPQPWPQLAAALRAVAEAKKRADLADLAGRIETAAGSDERALAELLDEARDRAKSLRKQGAAKELIGNLKDELLPAGRAALVSAANRVPRQWLLATARRVLQAFAEAKREAGRLDFDDVLAKAAALLGQESGPQLQFEHILIDEFQDTNPLQVQLVDRLLAAHAPSRPVRFVVGDINQSIYGFRHADQNVFRAYRAAIENEGGEVVRLAENFRSRSEIVAAVHRLLPGGAGSGVEAHRLIGANQFPPKPDPCVEALIVEDGGERALEREAAWLAQRLHELKQSLRLADRRGPALADRALQWDDVGILVRTHAKAARFAAALRQRGVPCRTSGGRSLFRAPETAELAAFLRILRNPRDEISLAAVLKSPFCGLGDASLLRLKLERSNLSEALEDRRPGTGELDADEQARLTRFRDLFAECRSDRDTVPTRLLLARAVAAAGYRSFLKQREDGLEALANVDRLLDWIERRSRQGAASLDAVSAALDAALEMRLAEKDAPDPASGGAVEILTMHAAKGLEFPVAVLASLQGDTPGTAPGLLFSEDHGLGARWRRPFQTDEDDAARRLAAADIRQREKEEADRLFYVAMTRAEEHLILSASFPGAAQARAWCKPLFARFRIDPKEAGPEEPETRTVDGLAFRYFRTQDDPSQDTLPTEAPPDSEPEILRPLAPSAQADYTAAVTSVAVFAECPRKYYLSRYLELEPDPARKVTGAWRQAAEEADRDGLDASSFGEQVHLYLAGQLAEADATPAARQLAERFRDHPLGRRAERAERSAKELSFVFAVGDFLLRGTIDLLFEEGGERILLDYKTDQLARDGLRQAARHYAPQLQLYAVGLARSGEAVDRAALFFLRCGEPVDIDIGRPELEGAQKLVGEFFDAQRRHEFPLRVGEHCRRCPHFRGPCPARLV